MTSRPSSVRARRASSRAGVAASGPAKTRGSRGKPKKGGNDGKKAAAKKPKKAAAGRRAAAGNSGKTAAEPQPAKIGRPTDYLPEYDTLVIEWTRQTGQSLTAFGGSIPVSRSTIDNWRKAHPSFDEACKIAMAVRTLVVETKAELETSAAQMNYKLLALKNCAPADWREQVDHRVGGLPGAPPVATAQIDVSKLTPEQVYAYVLNGAPLPPEATKDDED